MEIQKFVYRLVYELHRLETNEKVARSKIETDEIIDKNKNMFNTNISSCVEYIEKINQQLSITYSERDDGFLYKAKESIKSKMAESIKKRTPIIEKTKNSTS